MTLIEAVRSGKPFRRKCWSQGYHVLDIYKTIACSLEDILADDWEIQEEKIEITERQLRRIYQDVFGERPYSFDEFLKRLGFKND